MAERLKQWRAWIDARNLRERVLLLLSALAVVYGLWFYVAQDRLDRQRGEQQAQLNSLQAREETLREQREQLAALADDPDAELRERVAQLRTERESLDKDLAALSQGLIGASRLPQMLEQVLERSGRLELMEMHTLPVRELPLNSGAGEDAEATGVYRHTVSLRVAGDYFELLALLGELEALEWRFYWERLDYRVTDYPEAEVELRVYTLSAEEGLLGV